MEITIGRLVLRASKNDTRSFSVADTEEVFVEKDCRVSDAVDSVMRLRVDSSMLALDIIADLRCWRVLCVVRDGPVRLWVGGAGGLDERFFLDAML